MDGMELAQRLAPDFISIQVIAKEDDVRLLKERYPQVLAIGGGGAAGVAVEIVLLFQRCAKGLAFPKLLSGLAVEAEEHPLLILLNSGGEENFVAPDDR